MSAVSDQVLMQYKKESTYATAPTGANYQEIRMIGEGLKPQKEFVKSQEIRNDRQVADVILVGSKSVGNVNVELSYGSYDDWLEAALYSAGWSTLVTSTEVTYSMINSDNSINDSGNAFVSDGFVANQWLEIRGFANAANNGYFKASSVAIGKIVLVGGTVVDESASPSVTIKMGAQIVNGTTQSSFTIERQYGDLSNEWAQYLGQVIGKLNFDFSLKQPAKGSFEFMGKSEASVTASSGSGTDAATTTDVMNTVSNIQSILENNAAYTCNNLKIDLANNNRGRENLGTLGLASIGDGKVFLTGSHTAYYSSKTIMDKLLNDTKTSLALIIEDAAGNAYIIELPRMKYVDGKRVAGGENTDIVAEMQFEAYRHPTEDTSIRITKFAA